MKTIAELRDLKIKLSSPEMYLCQVKDLPNCKLDFNVFLPKRGIDLQREKVWTLLQKRELIMSIFIGRYIPCVAIASMIDYSDIKNSDTLQVIDGKQRLTTLIDFLNDEFSVVLDGDEYF